MNRFRHVLALGIIGLTLTSTAGAQILNRLDVQRLVDIGDPASHARLEEHFLALATQYDRESVRDLSVARASFGNVTRPFVPSAGLAWTQRAAAAAHVAVILRSLAAYHAHRAAGLSAWMTPDEAAFEGGAGAPMPTNAHVREMEAAAKTRADHHFLEEYFATVAAKQLDTIARYETIKLGYVANASHGSLFAIAECDRHINAAQRAVDEAVAAAARHHALADIG